MSDSVRPYRRQPTRLPCPWDSPGKNTGVGCHFLLQCIKVKSESEVAESCQTLSDPMDCGPPGSSIHGIFQARVLEWGAIALSQKKDIPFYLSSGINSFMLTVFETDSVLLLVEQRNWVGQGRRGLGVIVIFLFSIGLWITQVYAFVRTGLLNT